MKFHRILEVCHCAAGGFDRLGADYMEQDNALLRLFLLNPWPKLVQKDRLKVCRVGAKHEGLLGEFLLSVQG